MDLTLKLHKAEPDDTKLNRAAHLPYELQLRDFRNAMEDVYALLYDINEAMLRRGLRRLEETVRPAIFSGILSDALTARLAKHSRALEENRFHNGHPDLVPQGLYPNNAVRAGEHGVEVKATKGRGGVDTHGARDAWLCVFRWEMDSTTEPVRDRAPTRIVEIVLAHLTLDDFRHNPRGELGTRTASPNKAGLAKLRANWIYRE